MRTILRNLLTIGAAFVLTLYLGACTASEEAEREEGVTEEAPTKAPEPTTMKKDTAEVKVVPPAPAETPRESRPEVSTAIVYAVQVGAYENAENASRAEKLLKARFTQAVRTYYDQTTKLHKVSIGSFGTKDQALEFRKLLYERYPGEYQDAWIVEVPR
jgi:cell division septation protein DedD